MRTIESIHRDGFAFPWRIGCGGQEVPFHKDGKRYLYVWNSVTREHAYYCFDTDTFIPDTEWKQ